MITSKLEQFLDIFGCSISPYWNPMLGFDVIKFDENIVKPNDGESCSTAIERQWGLEACKFIRSLI